MIWEQVRGHADQVEMFRRAMRRNRWSQAYLFVGPDGIGKRLFARALAQCLFCQRVPVEDLDACGECANCRQMQAGSHPDYLTVGCPEGKNVLPLKAFIGDDENRGREGLCYEITLRPMAGDRRVAVIDDANAMNQEAGNALLKTLEEPPPFATIILIANNAASLLPTIRSRCQQVRFAPLAAEDVADLLLSQGVVEDRLEAETIAGLSDGSLSTAAHLLDPALRELRETLFTGLSQPHQQLSGLALSKSLLEGLDKLGSDAPAQRQNAIWLIRFGIDFYSRALRRLSGAASGGEIQQVERFAGSLNSADAEDVERIGMLLARLYAAEQQIQGNTPVPLCLEGLFDELARVSRPAAAAR